FSAWAGHRFDGRALDQATERAALLALFTAPPPEPKIPPSAQIPFTVLASGVPVGARLDVRAIVAEVPAPPVVVEAPSDPEESATKASVGAKKKTRARSSASSA